MTAGSLDEPGDDGLRVREPLGRPDPLDPLPAHGAQDVDRQQVAVDDALPPVPLRPVEQDGHGRAVWLVGARQDEVDLEGGVANAGADREPGRLQCSGDLTAVPTERALRGGQGPRGPSLGGLVEVGAQVFDAPVGGPLGVQVPGVEAGEDDDLPAGPGDGHVEAALAAGVVEHPEVQRQVAPRIGREGHREQDRVAFLALDVL